MTLTLCIYLGLLTAAQLLLAYRQHLIFQTITRHLALITQLRTSLNTIHDNMLDESADVAELKKQMQVALEGLRAAEGTLKIHQVALNRMTK